MHFDHVGIPTADKHPDEIWIQPSRVWITDGHRHPFGVEWLRYEPDSPVTGPLRTQPHVGFRVDRREEIETLSRGLKVLIEPFDAGFCVAGFYETADGAIIELAWYYDELSAWAERTRPAP